MKTHKTPMKVSVKLLTLLSVTIILFSSCLKDLSESEPNEVAGLNVVNASPGPLVVNFFLNNNLVNGPSIGFGQETAYIPTSAGTLKFDAATGGTFNSLVADTISLQDDKYYSLFITGENTALSTLLTEDDLSNPVAGKAKIRFINLGPDAGSLSLSVKTGASLFSAQPYKSVSSFTSIDPAVYMFELKNSAGKVIHEASQDVVAGKIYTVWAGGLKDGIDNMQLRLLIRANN